MGTPIYSKGVPLGLTSLRRPKVFKYVVIDSPLETLNSNAEADKIFGKMLGARIRGYRSIYTEGIPFPFAKCELLYTYVAICREDDDGFHPIYSYKIISNSLCKKYHLEFPVYVNLNHDGENEDLVHEIKNYVENEARSGREVAYLGSFCRDPSIILTLAEKNIVRDMLAFSFKGISEHMGTDRHILTASKHGGVTDFVATIGFEFFDPRIFRVREIANVEASLQYMENFNELTLKKVGAWREDWERRMHYSPLERSSGMRKAA